MWYNRDVSDLATTFKHGGRRPRAGRPPELQAQLVEARELAKQMRAAVKVGLKLVVDEYPELLKMAVELAKLGDTKVLLHLIDLPIRMGLTLADERASLADKVAAATVATVNLQLNVDTKKGEVDAVQVSGV